MRNKQHIKWVNRLRISQGHDGVYRVRSPEKPYRVLKESETEEAAYKWAHRNRKFAVKEPPWMDWELEFLADNYGRMPAEEIARRLRRSTNSLKIITFRKLGINQLSNIYTARNVAELLGVKCSKTIVSWYEVGFIKGKRAPFAYGANNVWFFDYQDIVNCLRKRPWLVDPKKMEESYFRSIVKDAYEKNPWYTPAEAAPLLGLVDRNAIHRYIYKGWLPAIKKPGGPQRGVWVIRHKDIRHFLLFDPRPEHRKAMILPSHLRTELSKIESRAWRYLARGRFELFGYWAAQWVSLNRMAKLNQHNPFAPVIEIATNGQKAGKEVISDTRRGKSTRSSEGSTRSVLGSRR